MTIRQVILDHTIEFTPAPEPQAELSLGATFYSGNENTQIFITINRSVRTDQVVDIDWAFTNVTVTPLSGTERFQLGETQKIIGVTAGELDTNESGNVAISNPVLISGSNFAPILSSPIIATVNIFDTDQERNAAHKLDWETGTFTDDRFYPLPDTAGNKCFQKTADLANIVSVVKGSPTVITVNVWNGWLDPAYEDVADGVILRSLSGDWAQYNGRMVRTRNLSNGDLTMELWYDHNIPGYMGDGTGLESSTDDGDMGKNPLDTTGFDNGWSGGQIEGVFRRIEQLEPIFVGSNTDQEVVESGDNQVHADTNVPARNGQYCLKDTIWYNKPYDVTGRESTGNLKGGNSGHNKPRSQFTLKEPELLVAPDTEAYLGWAMYIDSDFPEDLGHTGAESGNMLLSTGADNTDNAGVMNFEIHNPGPGTGSGEVNIPGPNAWFQVFKLNPDGLVTSNFPAGTKIYKNMGPISADRGYWVDFMMRWRWNPASVTENFSDRVPGALDQVFEANKGILEFWKSEGPYLDDFLNRKMVLHFSIDGGPVGSVPPANAENGAMDCSLRQYIYAWHRTPSLRTNTVDGVNKKVVMLWDDIRIGEVVRDGASYQSIHPGLQEAPTDPFTCNAVCWADTGQTMGEVPTRYAGYQGLRVWAQHFNFVEQNYSFDLSVGSHEIIYAHPTHNDHLTYRPAFLSGWSFTGQTGTMDVPDGNNGTVTIDVVYYKKQVSGTFTWNWLPSDWDNIGGHYVGFFLFPQSVTISNVFPELYDVIPDISNYSAFAHDWWLDPSPTTHPTVTQTVASWSALEAAVNAASPGDVIELQAGVYNDDGRITFTVSGDKANPIWIIADQCTFRGGTYADMECEGVRWWGGLDDQGTGNSGDERFRFNSLLAKWNSIEQFFWNGSSADNAADSWQYVNWNLGFYNRVSNCDVLDKESRGNCFAFNPPNNDTDSQFNMAQLIDCDGFNKSLTNWVGENNAFFRLGGNNNYYALMNLMVRLCRMANWNEVPNDAESMVQKSTNMVISQCVHICNPNNVSDKAFTPRVGRAHTVIGCYKDGVSNSTNVQGFLAHGSDPIPGYENWSDGQHFFGRNYVTGFDGFNGYAGANQINSTSSNRWVGNKAVITELYAPDAVDQVLHFGSSSNPDTPTGVKIRRSAITSTQDPVQEEYDTSTTVEFEGVVLDGPDADLGFAISGVPSGVTDADPAWVNRGDGVLIPTHNDLDNTTFIDCIPVDLIGPTISNLGVTR